MEEQLPNLRRNLSMKTRKKKTTEETGEAEESLYEEKLMNQ